MITLGILEAEEEYHSTYGLGLEPCADFKLLFGCGSVEEVPASFRTRLHQPDIIVLAVSNPEQLKNIPRIRNQFSHSRLLVIAGTFSDVDIRYLLRQGVYGCLVQPISSEELTSQLRRYHDGHPVFARPVLRRILELFNQLQGHEVYHPDHQLTERENEIARYLCKGLTYKQIGQQLNLSVYTVNQHLKKMYLKKGVNSRHELTSMIFSRES